MGFKIPGGDFLKYLASIFSSKLEKKKQGILESVSQNIEVFIFWKCFSETLLQSTSSFRNFVKRQLWCQRSHSAISTEMHLLHNIPSFHYNYVIKHHSGYLFQKSSRLASD